MSDLLAGRVRIRGYREDDVEPLQRLADDPLVARFTARTFPHPYTLDDAKAWIARAVSNPDVFVIESEGVFAGAIGIHPRDGEHEGSAFFGYWLGTAFWGRGIATTAARAAARYAFAERGLRRLEATVFAPNVASMRVLEKSGFRREALLRQAYVERDGTVVDGMIYGRLASDPEPIDG